METIEQIVTEMRICYWATGKYSAEGATVIKSMLKDFTDRIEAAHAAEVDRIAQLEKELGLFACKAANELTAQGREMNAEIERLRAALKPVLATPVGKMTSADCVLAVAQSQRIHAAHPVEVAMCEAYKSRLEREIFTGKGAN